ncbi:hypothetical protein BH11BAC7_BH11BAC7_26450 [soil metagenome]
MKSKLKIALLLFVFAGLTIVEFDSCKKYPDGPSFTLRTRTHRVAGTWRVENYKVNGTDYTSLVTDYTETYSKDGNYSYSWGSLAGTGTWTFENNDEEIQISGVSNQDDHRLFIMKLEEKSFWYYYMDGSDRKEVHLIQ